jgi:cellulose biosynthesis protein BcsQ
VLYGATRSVLRAATHQLMVVAAEPGALRACEAFQARLARELPQGPRLLGMLLNMLDYQLRASVHALEELSESAFAPALLDTAVPRSSVFMEASARGVPVAHTQAKSPLSVAWVFETLAATLLERLELEQPSLEDSPLLS